jgi:CubicO group peptidase (beta-lactamase class C family)
MTTINPDIYHRLQSRLSERLQTQLDKFRIPGAAIAIYHQDNPLEAAVGSANLEAGIDIDPHTVFQIGSTTKVFTATLMIMLVDEGLIELDAPVSRYLPDLQIDNHPAPDALTVRSLLDYSAGMEGDYFTDFGPGPEALERYVNACHTLQYIHPPGEMRAYNSTAYCIAGRVIEAVTGRYYEDVLQEKLLQPIGTERFGFYTHDVIRYRTAIGHEVDQKTGELRAVDNLRLPHCMSAAGASLSMTAKDLLRFGCFHLNNGVTRDGKPLVCSDLIQQMRTPYKIVPPCDSELLMGWAALESDRGRVTVASGMTHGQNSFLALLPAEKLAISILANTATGANQIFLDLGVELIKALSGATVCIPEGKDLRDLKPVPLAEVDTQGLLGEYLNGTQLEISENSEGLQMTATYDMPDRPEPVQEIVRLVPIGGNKFLTEKEDTPSQVVEFLFADGESSPASQVFCQNRLFARRR